MKLFSFLPLLASLGPRGTPAPDPCQPTLEHLEERCVPATFEYDGVAQHLVVNGTAGDDSFSFTQSKFVAGAIAFEIYHFRMNNETAEYRSAGSEPVSTVAVNGLGGNDTGVLSVDNVTFLPNGVLEETSERALLGPEGDILQKQSNSGYYNFLTSGGFEATYAYMGNNDHGQLFDSPGDDFFVTAGSYSYMTGPNGYFRLVSGADDVYGYTINGGNDQAFHYGSAGLDAFVASGNAYSYLSGGSGAAAFFNEAVGFDVTYAVSTGNDIAYLIDTPGNDTFFGGTAYSYLSGPGTFNLAQGFATVYAQSFVGGTDYAYNTDPSHNVLGGNWIRL